MVAVILMLFMLQLAVTSSESYRCIQLECLLWMKCAFGFEVDRFGCPICACRLPCSKADLSCCRGHYCFVSPKNDSIPVCKPYCPQSLPLSGGNGLPVQCVTTKCPERLFCHNVTDLNSSVCCHYQD
ncbi:uncharacterized protein LOC116173720 [Photinus pyralis]|nr:uncharacterized protein LOC116173720 [Photinus pyralis]XP_031347257.1 uncharacterized protein LOC116173720 [Photinus pyralis]